MPSTAERVSLALIPIAFALLVYYPITSNYFYADDFPNLFLIENAPLATYLLRPHGGHILLTRNAAFYATAKVFGAVPAYFFWTVLLTHLLNTWLLFRLIERLSASRLAACFGATLWATSPVHQEALGWYSVYGQVLVATIVLLILGRAERLARSGEPLPWRVAWSWLVLALLAATCFGTGIGVALAVPAVAFTLPPAVRGRPLRLVPLLSLLAIVPALYLGLLRAYTAVSGVTYPTTGIIGAALSRWDRALAMLLQLIAYASSRLPLGFFDVPHPYPNAVSYALSAGFASSIALLVWRSPQTRRPIAACLIFLLATYGMIAAGRAQYFEGAVAIDFLISQGRYHYVGFLLLTIPLCLLLGRLGTLPRLPYGAKVAALALWLAWTAASALRMGPVIDHHDKAREAVGEVLAAVDRKAAQAPPGRPVFVMNRYFEPVPAYFFRLEDFPGWAGVFTVFHPTSSIDGRRVYFMQRNPAILEKLKRGKRTADLIVAPRAGADEDKGTNPFRDVIRRSQRKPPGPGTQPAEHGTQPP
jgi:hypothetical protein